eukprot:4894330-Pleurochrysis_carterae.AAC.1
MLVARCLTQELDVLEAVACVMHTGVRQGQVVACQFTAGLKAGRFTGPKRVGSKREGSPRLACEFVRVAQLLRSSGKELLTERVHQRLRGARTGAGAHHGQAIAAAHEKEKL